MSNLNKFVIYASSKTEMKNKALEIVQTIFRDRQINFRMGPDHIGDIKIDYTYTEVLDSSTNESLCMIITTSNPEFEGIVFIPREYVDDIDIYEINFCDAVDKLKKEWNKI